MIDDKDIKAQADLITDGIMGGSEWQTYPLPTTIGEAINTIDDVITREVAWADGDTSDIEKSWSMILEKLGERK
ncbi:hypothetical protein [Hyphomonas sp.]|jgi:hypothetical protein|uniref:hypothetical protein n=1 Tax=Hyphomonas sp. TaxID=87 RepID=UPI000C8CE773|nr:hypothetical protein [Hyphomonas sp.]MAL44512.1 hypothetical protein [Hyphomonas sp.]|tara:strand:+ start:934 stop:1155 length:222 start_codon:yes stop_codon:yes gene_type:complete